MVLDTPLRSSLAELRCSVVPALAAKLPLFSRMAQLRAPKTDDGGEGVSLVIMHSFLGDESGYERLWKMHLLDPTQ